MKIADPTSYLIMDEQLLNDEKDNFLFSYSIFNLIICLIECITIQVLKNRKVNNGLEKTKAIKNLDSKCLNYFNSLQEPLIIINGKTFYFNDYAKNYYLHNSKRIVSIEAFKELLHENDISLLKMLDRANVNFRIINNRSNSFDWFESCFAVYQGNKYCVIRKIVKESYEGITIGDFDLMNKKIEELRVKKKRFGAIIIHINNLLKEDNSQYLEVDDEIIRVVIISRYLLSIRDYLQLCDIYKLSSNEFGFIIEDTFIISYLMNKTKINDSMFNDYSFYIDEAKYKVMADSVMDCDNFMLESLLSTFNSKIINKTK